MTIPTTNQDFYKQPIEIQKAVVFGWALAIIQGNEDIDEKANVHITGVDHLDNKEAFRIDWRYTAGIKPGGHSDADTGHNFIDESENIYCNETFWLPSFKDMPTALFKLHTELTEAKFDEEYNGKSDED